MNSSNYRNIDLSLFLVMEQLWMTRSVSETAQRLNFAQSTVSMALRRLREQFKDELFVWNGQVMQPTPRAESLMPEVREIIFKVRELLDSEQRTIQSAQRHFVLATADYVSELYGPELIRRASDSGHHFTFNFVEIKPQLLNRSSLPDVDMFLMPWKSLQTFGLSKETLYTDEYVCIAHRDNDSLYEEMSPEEFVALPHVGYTAIPRTTFSHEAYLWQQLGLIPNFVVTSASYSAFPRIVAESEAVAIVPSKVARLALTSLPLKIIRPPLPSVPFELAMVWRPEQDDDTGHQWLRAAFKDIASALTGSNDPPEHALPHQSVT